MYTLNTKEKQKQTALANKTNYTLIYYTIYDLRPVNWAGPVFTAPEPLQAYQVIWIAPHLWIDLLCIEWDVNSAESPEIALFSENCGIYTKRQL